VQSFPNGFVVNFFEVKALEVICLLLVHDQFQKIAAIIQGESSRIAFLAGLEIQE
jgi:hypothetical protein